MNSDYPYRSPPGSKDWLPGLSALGHMPVEAMDEEQPWTDSPQLPSAPPLTTILTAALLLCMPANAIIVPLSEAVRPPSGWTHAVLAIAGLMVAQAGLLSILAVWGSGPWWMRLALHWGVAAALILSWCLGWCWAYGYRLNALSDSTLQDARMLLGGLLLCSLLVQAVPWLLRVYWGWTIQPRGASAQAVAARLSIRDLLLATVMAALAVGAARASQPESAPRGEYWLAWLLTGIGVGVFVLLTLVPTVYCTLRMRSPLWAGGCLVFISAIIAIPLMATLIASRPYGGPDLWWIVLAMLALVLGYMGGLAGPLLIARSSGYRLETGGKRSQTRGQWQPPNETWLASERSNRGVGAPNTPTDGRGFAPRGFAKRQPASSAPRAAPAPRGARAHRHRAFAAHRRAGAPARRTT